MDVRTELIHALDRIQEPPAQPPSELLAAAARSVQSRRRRRSGLGVAAILGVATLAASASAQGWFSDTTDSDLVSVASPGELPTGEVPADLLPMHRLCGAIIDPTDNRVYLADGAKVLRRADDVVDPAVAPHSIALEVRLASGQIRWIGAGWVGSTMGGGCDDPSKPDTSRPHSSKPAPQRTFDDFVENLWDGNGMKVQ